MSTQAAAAATAMGSSGLGTTASQIFTGGGGGGGRDFRTSLQMLAPSGARVSKGDVVAEFDREAMEVRLDDYRASVTQYEANFEKSKAEVDVTRKAHDHSIGVAELLC